MDNEWQVVEENGQEYHIHEKYGNIVKIEDGSYLVLIPKIFRLGPFKELEMAKRTAISNQRSLDELAKNFNGDLMNLIEEMKENK
ncbi:hypothetical protein HYV49_03255 [Candidatus Pacearchaeota archaeon]|nr:hypothetical protein [Candidatus Pacearchaeota archaeon]